MICFDEFQLVLNNNYVIVFCGILYPTNEEIQESVPKYNNVIKLSHTHGTL